MEPIGKLTMTLWACLLIMVWICPGVPAFAQLFLPSEIAGWRWDNQEERHDSRTLYGYMDGAAELYLSLRFSGSHGSPFREVGSALHHR